MMIKKILILISLIILVVLSSGCVSQQLGGGGGTGGEDSGDGSLSCTEWANSRSMPHYASDVQSSTNCVNIIESQVTGTFQWLYNPNNKCCAWRIIEGGDESGEDGGLTGFACCHMGSGAHYCSNTPNCAFFEDNEAVYNTLANCQSGCGTGVTTTTIASGGRCNVGIPSCQSMCSQQGGSMSTCSDGLCSFGYYNIGDWGCSSHLGCSICCCNHRLAGTTTTSTSTTTTTVQQYPDVACNQDCQSLTYASGYYAPSAQFCYDHNDAYHTFGSPPLTCCCHSDWVQPCSDTDGGLDRLYQGTCVDSSGNFRQDYCMDAFTQVEYFCSNNQCISQITNCETYYGTGYQCAIGIGVCYLWQD